MTDSSQVGPSSSRIQRWLEALRSLPTGESVNVSAVLHVVREALLFENNIRASLSTKDQTTQETLTISLNDFSFMITRLVYPRLVAAYKDLLAKAGDVGDSTPVIGGAPSSFEDVETYFKATEDPSRDFVSLMCAMTDLVQRIEKHSSSDMQKLSKIKAREESVTSKTATRLQKRSESIKFLKGEDEEKLVSTTSEGLQQHVQSLSLDLAQAEQEEEEARKAYERAMAKTRSLREKVHKVGSVYNTLETQKSALLRVHETSTAIDQTSIELGQHRVALIDSLMETHDNCWQNAVRQDMLVTLQPALQSWSTLFTKIREDGLPDPFRIRLGREVMTLWRKQVPESHPLFPALQGLQVSLNTSTVPKGELNSDSIVSNTQQTDGTFNSSTVVLYNTHEHHETPTDHVENHARVKTSVQIILQRVNQFATASQRGANGDNRTDSRRTVAMMNCNDIVSAPLYTLPLVHSPQYLQRIYVFSKEAQEEDLYVPLEFDTEWETEMEYSDDSDSDNEVEDAQSRRGRAFLRSLDASALSSVLNGKIDEAKVKQLTQMLTPSRRDIKMAGAIFRGDHDAYPGVSSSMTSTSERHFNIGRRVRTTYGIGTILQDYHNRQADMYRVKMDWGAIAYLHESAIISAMRASRGSGRSSGAQRVSLEAGQPNAASGASGSGSFERFKCTDLRLHKLIRRMLTTLKLQRLITIRTGIKDANFSLWMHGRTSRGHSKHIEDDVRNWLRKYDRQKLEDVIVKYEAMPDEMRSADDFLNELDHIRVAGNQPFDDSFDSAEMDEEALRQEAMDYSAGKLTTRSGVPRYSGPRRPRTSHKDSAAGMDDDDDNSDNAAGSAGAGNKRKRTVSRGHSLGGVHGKRAEFHPAPPHTYRSVEETSFNERLRHLYLNVTSTLRLTQAMFCQDIGETIGLRTNQTSISAWVRHKLSLELGHSYNDHILRWVELHKDVLNEEAAAALHQLKQDFQNLALEVRLPRNKRGHHWRRDHTVSKIKSEVNQGGPPVPSPLPQVAVKTERVASTTAAPQSSTASSGLLFAQHQLLSGLLPKETTISSSSGAELLLGDDAIDAAILEFGNEEEMGGGGVEEEGDDDDSPAPADDSAVKTITEVKSEPMEVEGDHEDDEEDEYVEDGAKEDDDSDSSLVSDATPAGKRQKTQSPQQAVSASISSQPQLPPARDALVPRSVPIPAGEPLLEYTKSMIVALHEDFVNESTRRNLTHTYLCREAERLDLVLAQPIISKFFRTGIVPYVGKKDEFCSLVKQWVEYSKTRPPPFKEDPNESEVLLCSNCQRESLEFPRQRDFYDHLARCGKVSAKKGRQSGGDGLEDEDDDDDDDAEEEGDDEEGEVATGERIPRRRGRGRAPALAAMAASSQTKRRATRGVTRIIQDVEMSPGEIKDMESKLLDGRMDIQHYPYTRGMRYPCCEQCGESGATNGHHKGTKRLITCLTCPCQYHVQCLEGSDAAEIEESLDDDDPVMWNCPVCQQSGVVDAVEVPEEVKRFALVPRAEVFCFFPHHRAWKQGYFLASHSKESNLALIRFTDLGSRADRASRDGSGSDMDDEDGLNKAGDDEEEEMQWVDLDLSTILATMPSEGGDKNHENDSSSNIYARPYLYRKRARTTFFNVPAQQQIHRRRRNAHGVGGAAGHKSKATTRSRSGRRPANVSVAAAAAAAADGLETPVVTPTAGEGMSDTYISATSMRAALAAAGIACKAVDVVLRGQDSNAFACIRPPGHHAGRHGCTTGCLSTGFCLLNNAAIALTYARVHYGLIRIAVVDIDVHFGNGTAEILRGDPDAFFASVHMVYGPQNDGRNQHGKPSLGSPGGTEGTAVGFYPAELGRTEVTDRYVCVGVQPDIQSNATSSSAARRQAQWASNRANTTSLSTNASSNGNSQVVVKMEVDNEDENGEDEVEKTSKPVAAGDDDSDIESISDQEGYATAMEPNSDEETRHQPRLPSLAPESFIGGKGFLHAVQNVIVPKLEAFAPELLIISAGFDGYKTDPVGGILRLSLHDYAVCTKMLTGAMERVAIQTNDPVRAGRVVSLLEGGYDTSPATLGLARCVEMHVSALRDHVYKDKPL